MEAGEFVSRLGLVIANAVSSGVLHITDFSLSTLSIVFSFLDSWKDALLMASDSVREVNLKKEKSITEVIQENAVVFSQIRTAISNFTRESYNLIYDNKNVASVIGSSKDNLLGFSDIKMSFRANGEDITTETAFELFQKSKKSKAVLMIPGLFCDERVWRDKVKPDGSYYPGISTVLDELGLYPVYLRFNPGLHISSNGKYLLSAIKKWISFSKKPFSVISYSQGGLVLRSALYYSTKENIDLRNSISDIHLISTPNGGSYLEKLGYWAGLLVEKAAPPPFHYIGVVGNLRSDGIKDLSHGVIRDDDWKDTSQINRYLRAHYHGELDSFRVFEYYSVLSDLQNPISNWFGDGIIEKASLSSLTKILEERCGGFQSKVYPGFNHFSLMESVEFQNDLKKSIFL